MEGDPKNTRRVGHPKLNPCSKGFTLLSALVDEYVPGFTLLSATYSSQSRGYCGPSILPEVVDGQPIPIERDAVTPGLMVRPQDFQ